MKGRVTLEDVARRAGVSLATASGALNEVPRFSAETVARVRQAMRELGYTPRRNKLRDRSIRRHRTNSVGTVAFVFPDPLPETAATPLSKGMLRGAETAVEALLAKYPLDVQRMRIKSPAVFDARMMIPSIGG